MIESQGKGPRGVVMGGCMGSSEMYFFWLFSLMDFVKKLPHVYTISVVIFRKVGDRERGGTGHKGVGLGGWYWVFRNVFFWAISPDGFLFKNLHTCIQYWGSF